MIDIIDYGIGNIGSVQNMIKHIGGESRIISGREEIMNSKKLILPGVGSFDTAISTLQDKNLVDAISYAVKENQAYLLGICLGMQLLFEGSEEGIIPGLGFIKGQVIKFSDDINLRIPHVGWNQVKPVRKSVLFDPEDGFQKYYFTHSYYATCIDKNDISAVCPYGNDFVCSVERDNIFGTQFHPEKSHRFGMRLLSKFHKL